MVIAEEFCFHFSNRVLLTQGKKVELSCSFLSELVRKQKIMIKKEKVGIYVASWMWISDKNNGYVCKNNLKLNKIN